MSNNILACKFVINMAFMHTEDLVVRLQSVQITYRGFINSIYKNFLPPNYGKHDNSGI